MSGGAPAVLGDQPARDLELGRVDRQALHVGTVHQAARMVEAEGGAHVAAAGAVGLADLEAGVRKSPTVERMIREAAAAKGVA